MFGGPKDAAALSKYDEDPGLFVEGPMYAYIVRVSPPQNKAPLPQIQRYQTHQTPGQEPRSPGLRGASQLYVNVAICPAAAPLPLGTQLGLPFGLRKV